MDLVATIAFFHLTIQAKIEALSLSPGAEQAVLANLIPALYIRRVADKAKVAEVRHHLRKKSDKMLISLQCENGPFAGLTQEELNVIESVADECAGVFQRSSSCVEGRNGQLSLRHHSLHRFSNRKMGALTTVHNYFSKRRDKTTPAERFFGKKPSDLFEFLLERVDLPARPAQIDNYERLKEYHYKWVEEELKNKNLGRDSKWTESIGVGDKFFLKTIKEKLGYRVRGRSIFETGNPDSYQLRESQATYGTFLTSDLSNKFPWGK